MRKGAVGLLILVLLSLIIIVVLFVSSKFIMPNPQTIKENKKIQNDAQDAINKYQQKNIQDQLQEIN